MINKILLDKLQDDILIFNEDKIITFCNKHLLVKLGYEALEQCPLDQIVMRHEMGEKYLTPGENRTYAFKDYSGILHSAQIDIIQEESEKPGYWLLIRRWADENYTKAELQQMVDAMPTAVWIEDFEKGILFVNQTGLDEVKRFYKKDITREELYYKNAIEVWGKRISQEQWQKDKEILRNGGIINEVRYMKDKSILPCYIILKLPIKDEEGHVSGYIVAMNSQIECRRVEEELIEKYRMFKQPMVKQFLDTEQGDGTVPKYYNLDDMAICEYDEERERLQVAANMGTDQQALLEIEKLPVSRDDYEILVRHAAEGESQRLEKMLLDTGKKWKILNSKKHIVQYPITYRNQCFGILAATYTQDTGEKIINKKELQNSCHNLAVIINSIRLTDRIQEELALRKKMEGQMKDLYDTTIGLYCAYNFKEHKWVKIIGWQDVLGWNEDELTTLDEPLYQEDKEQVLERFKAVKSGENVGETVSRFKCRDGSYRWIKWKAKLGDDKESFITYGIDVTEQVESLRQRKIYQEALELEKVKGEFLANMSHELKTPLNIIYGIIQLIEVEMKEEEGAEEKKIEINKIFRYESIMKQNIFRLLRLINNIVDISRIGAGAYAINLQNCNIVEIVEDITMSVVEYMKDKKINIIFDTQEEEIETACDIDKMERVILNLLSNAVKYSKETGNILVNMRRVKKRVLIEITDDGIGIPEDRIKSIFKRFVQVDQSFTRKCEGSGIGLSLVKLLVEMMGGKISVASQLGVGTTFTIDLPIKKVKQTHLKQNNKEVSSVNSRIEKCYIEFSDVYTEKRDENQQR